MRDFTYRAEVFIGSVEWRYYCTVTISTASWSSKQCTRLSRERRFGPIETFDVKFSTELLSYALRRITLLYIYIHTEIVLKYYAHIRIRDFTSGIRTRHFPLVLSLNPT